MKYLGIVKQKGGNLLMPDAFLELADKPAYEAIQVGDDVLLVSAPPDRKRLERIRSLADASIKDHRTALERLGR
jgi:hypothetical protein